ncbi:SDR family NAD(P)-dependent oxidoreductase [Corallococcus macrosporus]|uniref:Dehydrogenase n=1 Tax=Corallococcus macrosporus DSM 14697 TaxID=1189310 RepID=A0A250JRE0_9BACT|nr:SDR family NAD(P)-dependent oxidoreductase [Corallococcus macrosporus]ATB46190.1 dehydrogenase [Corallococcus macrosporus DSM 14697]
MDSTGKTALVTGGNKGIGFAVVRQLAAHGYTTWLGSRDEARGRAAVAALEEAGAGDVRFIALDVTDEASVAAAAARIASQTPSLDVLINNAGIYVKEGDGAPSTVRLDAMRATYDVNVFGPLRVTAAFLPLLRAARGAHVVMVGAGLGSLTLQLDPSQGLSRWPAFAYSSSKTALNALTVGFANELREEGIVVTVVNPGFVATDLNGHAGTLTTDEGAERVLRAVQLPLSATGSFVTDHGTCPW